MRSNILNPLSWSLAVKIFMLVMVPIILLLAIIYSAVISGAASINLDRGLLLAEEIGKRQAAAIASTLITADLNTQTFVERNLNAMFSLLIDQTPGIGAGVPLRNTTTADVVALMRREMLSLPTSLFDSVRLINRQGRVLAQASRSAPLSGDPSGTRAPAYIAALSAGVRGEDRLLSIAQVNFTPIFEQVEILRWRDGSVIGYLVVRLNNRRAFNDYLALAEETNLYEFRSFVVSSNDILVSAEGVRATTLRAADSLATDRALDGQAGTAIYTASDGISYAGYYTVLRNVPLGLITQTPVARASAANEGVFLPQRIGTAIAALVVAILAALLITQVVVPPLNRLRRTVQNMTFGNLDTDVPDTRRRDEIGALATNIDALREQVRNQIDGLQTSIDSRVRDLDATQEISRFAVTQRNLQLLMDSVVNLIIQRFPNIYHAQIFLTDGEGQDALLKASTGAVGQELLRRGHRLGVGSVSVIGQVTAQGRVQIARDTAVNPVHRRNEFLPDTRAELAVPLRIGDTIMGALDVQSRERDAFNEEQVEVLQTMADQIAVAIQNARLYEDVNRRLQDIEERNRRATLVAWQDYMRDRRQDEITREAGLSSEYDQSDLKEAARLTGEVVVGRVTPRQTIPLAVPVVLRGQVLGIVQWELPVSALSEDKLELARELAGRLAISLENARLFQESQRSAERERIVNSIVANLTTQTTIDGILQTAVREVGQALRAPQVSIRIAPATAPASADLKPESNGHST